MSQLTKEQQTILKLIDVEHRPFFQNAFLAESPTNNQQAATEKSLTTGERRGRW